MGIIAKMKRLSNLNAGYLIQSAIEDNEDRIVALNQEQLYEQGIQADDTVTGTYAPITYRSKEQLGQRNDHITLSDTGEFYESMKVTASGAIGVITGDSDKGDQDLSDRWPAALGLTSDNMIKVKSLIVKNVLKQLNEA